MTTIHESQFLKDCFGGFGDKELPDIGLREQIEALYFSVGPDGDQEALVEAVQKVVNPELLIIEEKP